MWYIVYFVKIDPNQAKSQIGKVFKELRGELGLTQQQLCDVVLIDRSYLIGIEKGAANISLDVIIRMACALKTRPSEVFSKAGF